MPELLTVGCDTPATGGRGAGIVLIERDRATGRLRDVVAVLPTPSPSYLTRADPAAGPTTGGQPGDEAGSWSTRRTRLLHVTGELDPTLLTSAPRGGRLGALRAASALAGSSPGGSPGGSPGSSRGCGQERPGLPSEVTPLPGRLLLVARRGRDVLTVHAVDDDGATRAVVDVPLDAAGDGRPPARNPRHAVALGQHVFVSAQDSDLVLHLELAALGEGLDGAGARVVAHSAVSTGSPTAVLPL